MADVGLIDALMRECSTMVVRKLSPEEYSAALRVWSRHLEPYPGELLGQAVDAWIMNQSDDKPPFKLPSVKLIMRVAADLSDAPSSRTASEETFRNFVPARRSFVDAHMKAQREIKRLDMGLLQGHDHKKRKIPVTDENGRGLVDENGHPAHEWVGGAGACPVCGPGGDARRAMVDEILDGLPEPQASGARSCKCDGSGWIEEKDPLSHDVYPCSSCNPFFWEWRGVSPVEA